MSDAAHIPEIALDAIAMEITGNAHLPIFREGDVLIVSPSSNLRRGDRVAVKFTDGRSTVQTLGAMNRDMVELTPLAPGAELHVHSLKGIEWIARVVWASQ